MIFPDWGTVPAHSGETDLPVPTEWAVDWDAGSFALRSGEPYTVSGMEALKIWVYCALHPDSRRFLFSAHSHDYGNQLPELLSEAQDSGILESRIRREIQNTLLISPYIRAVDNFSFASQGSRLTVSFTVHSIYEDFQQEVRI